METVFDTDNALERVEGDMPLLLLLADIFRQNAAGWMAEIKVAEMRGDAGALEAVSHSLRGAAGNLGALAVSAAAESLEIVAASGDVAACGVLVEDLAAHMRLLDVALGELLE